MTDISGSNTVSDGYNKVYTPTTEEVSKSYVWFRDQAFTDEKLKAEFDRWLSEVKAQEISDLIARIEMAVVLLEDGEITPTGRRMIEKVLSHYRQGEIE